MRSRPPRIYWILAYLATGLGAVSTAYAADILLYPDLVHVPWASIGLSTLLALWGGLAATITRTRNLDRPYSLRTEIIKDAIVSMVAGTLAYFFGALYALSIWQVMILLVSAGYSGARALDAYTVLSDKWRSGPTAPKP